MRTEIKKVHQKVRTTTVYVTHDQVEAMTLADRVVVMNAGRIEQVGAPNELYHSPATQVRRRLHRLAGDELRSPAGSSEAAGGLRAAPCDKIAFPIPQDRDRALSRPTSARQRLLCGLRPEHIFEQRRTSSRARSRSRRCPRSSSRWATRRWSISRSTASRSARASIPAAAPQPGAPLKLVADLRHLHLIDDSTGKVL